MKTYTIALTCLFILSLNAYAQDIMYLQNGHEIKCKVSEVGVKLVKYKKFENLQGPMYEIKKTDLKMIRYENGYKEVFNPEENIGGSLTKYGGRSSLHVSTATSLQGSALIAGFERLNKRGKIGYKPRISFYSLSDALFERGDARAITAGVDVRFYFSKPKISSYTYYLGPTVEYPIINDNIPELGLGAVQGVSYKLNSNLNLGIENYLTTYYISLGITLGIMI